MLKVFVQLQLAAFSLQLAACRLQLAACSMPRAACSLQLAACSLPPAACSLHPEPWFRIETFSCSEPLVSNPKPFRVRNLGFEPKAFRVRNLGFEPKPFRVRNLWFRTENVSSSEPRFRAETISSSEPRFRTENVSSSEPLVSNRSPFIANISRPQAARRGEVPVPHLLSGAVAENRLCPHTFCVHGRHIKWCPLPPPCPARGGERTLFVCQVPLGSAFRWCRERSGRQGWAE
jgi:hypothetical protein